MNSDKALSSENGYKSEDLCKNDHLFLMVFNLLAISPAVYLNYHRLFGFYF